MSFAVHFGGPHQPVDSLRNLLSERIAAAPSGGAIDWVTYYLRDLSLAHDLLRARARGVEVRVTIEGCPRTPDANDAVAALLSGPGGLGDGFRSVVHRRILPTRHRDRRPRLHTKLYAFSHPTPTVLVGSFNPTGDASEDAADVAREIGDHGRGRNLLVEIHDPGVVAALQEHARQIHASRHGVLERFGGAAHREIDADGIRLFFGPRLRRSPVPGILAGFGASSRVRIAASHMRGRTFFGMVHGLARRGAALEILADASHRRIPPGVEDDLRAAGIVFARVTEPPDLPMHDKFVLAERPGHRIAIFGSFNWTDRSLHLNHELGAISTDPTIYAALDTRWTELENAASSD